MANMDTAVGEVWKLYVASVQQLPTFNTLMETSAEQRRNIERSDRN